MAKGRRMRARVANASKQAKQTKIKLETVAAGGKQVTKKSKRLKKHELLMQRVREQSDGSKKLNALGGLSNALRLHLDDEGETKVAHPHQPTGHPVRAKTRNKTMAKEVEQFAAVLQHPAFKTDPMAALRQHLANTLKDTVQ